MKLVRPSTVALAVLAFAGLAFYAVAAPNTAHEDAAVPVRTPIVVSGDAGTADALPDEPKATAAATASSSTNKPATVNQQENGVRLVASTNANQIDAFDGEGWMATFTKGSRTVTVRGPERTFSEPAHTSAYVRHGVWVRVLSMPFTGEVDVRQLRAMITDRTPDILAIAMQYTGDKASYGPLMPDGSREEGSDYNDFLGIDRAYGPVIDSPENRQRGSLDCSGFVRMILGYHAGLPLTNGSSVDGRALPRRAVQMHASAPGTIVIPRQTNALERVGTLRPGDLLFADASRDDGNDIDHVGIYMGRDNSGNHRFISSRKAANGPTMGDTGGASIIDGPGLYSRSFAAARRL